MKKVKMSLLVIMMLVSTAIVTAFQAQQNEYEVINTSTDFALSNWYACNHGDYQPACEAIGNDATSEASITNISSNALGYWYACNYGDYQPACEAINMPANTYNIT